jgi:hypothetical protein
VTHRPPAAAGAGGELDGDGAVGDRAREAAGKAEDDLVAQVLGEGDDRLLELVGVLDAV